MIYTAFNGLDLREREREREIMKDDLKTESKPTRPVIIISFSPDLNLEYYPAVSTELLLVKILWELASYSDNLAFFSRSHFSILVFCLLFFLGCLSLIKVVGKLINIKHQKYFKND